MDTQTSLVLTPSDQSALAAIAAELTQPELSPTRRTELSEAYFSIAERYSYASDLQD